MIVHVILIKDRIEIEWIDDNEINVTVTHLQRWCCIHDEEYDT
jgi:hypothetical protein